MAKPKTSKAAAAPEKAFKIVVEATADTPTYYINHVEIAVNQHELAMWFARLPTKPSRFELDEALATGELVVDPEFQILIAPTLLEGLISALQSTKETYEGIFGPIRRKTDDADG